MFQTSWSILLITRSSAHALGQFGPRPPKMVSQQVVDHLLARSDFLRGPESPCPSFIDFPGLREHKFILHGISEKD